MQYIEAPYFGVFRIDDSELKVLEIIGFKTADSIRSNNIFKMVGFTINLPAGCFLDN